MRHNNDEQLFLAIVLIVTGIAAAGIWKFSQFMGLDMWTGFRLMVGIITITGILWLVCSQMDLSIGATLPLALAVLWINFWPALDVWAIPNVPSFMLDSAEPRWFGTWYAKIGGLVAILGIGYGPWLWRSR
ncbi:hypothetical protein RBH89_13150 [Paracidovorax avenae]